MRGIFMCEVFERKDQKHKLDYDREEPEDITKSLMILSERSLHDFLASEPDIYNKIATIKNYFPLQKAKSISPLIGRWGWMLCSQAI